MKLVLILNGLQYKINIGLQYLAAHYNFIEDKVRLVAVKYEIELAYILEAFVKCFHKDLNQIQNTQIALLCIHGKHKVKSGVVAVYYLGTLAPLGDAPLEIVAEGIGTVHHLLIHPPNNLLLLVV